jgi:hypothetical protein
MAKNTGRGSSASNVCKDCKAEGKPLTRQAPYVGPRCRTHHFERRRALRLARSQQHVQRTYSISPEQYDALLRAQGGKCAGCGRATGASKRLAVDHDHSCCIGPTSCGRCIRMLVCGTCNDILAHSRDNPAYFDRMAENLRNWPSRRAGIVPPAGSFSTTDVSRSTLSVAPKATSDGVRAASPSSRLRGSLGT